MSSFYPSSEVDDAGGVAALAVGLVWLLFSLLLKKPRTHQWLALGFISPFLVLPLFLLLGAWFEGHGDPRTPLYLGFMVAVVFSWLCIPLGLAIGTSSAIITWLFEGVQLPESK